LYVALDFARYEPNAWAAPYYACALVLLGLAVLVARGRRGSRQRDEARRAFALNMSILAAVILTMGLGIAAGDREQCTSVVRIGAAASMLLGPSMLQFACVLLGWTRHLRVVRFILLSSGLGVAALSLATPWVIADAWTTPWGYAAMAGVLAPLLLLHLFVSTVVFFSLLWGRYRQTTDPADRAQLRTVMFAYGIGNLTCLDLASLWGVVVIPSAFVWVTLSAVILAYAVRAHSLFDASDLGWRALAWLFTSVVSAGPIALALVLSGGWQGWGRPWPTTLALLLGFLGMRAMSIWLQPRIDDLFLRRQRDLAREVDALSDKLLVLHTAETIADEMSRVLSRTLYVKLVAFAVRDPQDSWRMVRSAWGSVPPPVDTDELVVALVQKRQLVSRSRGTRSAAELGQQTKEQVAAERMFARYGAEVILPLPAPSTKGTGLALAGLLAVGPRPDGRPFEPLEVEFLSRLRSAVAGPLAAASLYDRRHRLRLELEEKVAARTADLARAVGGLKSSQSQLVQTEKMATLGLVVAGVAAELESAVETVSTNVPELEESVNALEAAAERCVSSLPEGPEGDEVRTWMAKRKFEFVRKDMKPLVEAVAEGARRAQGIAVDLGRFARADEVSWESVDLHRELDSTLNLLRHDLADRVRIERDYADGVPLVECDRGPVGQVFMNLLCNAVQAIEGQGWIRVGTRLSETGQRVQIIVRDSGRGISPEHLSRIFEPFFTTKTFGQKGGTGLGLSISYGIVQRHGGRITVESWLGQGTEFTVVLPVKSGRRWISDRM
jgi:signal transduction histidine kinase